MTEATLVKAPRPAEKLLAPVPAPEKPEKQILQDLISRIDELRCTGKLSESQSGFLYTAQGNLINCLSTFK